MKKVIFILMAGFILASCGVTEGEQRVVEIHENPFFNEWCNSVNYGAPPFEQIENRHFMPAFEEAVRQQAAEVEAIANNTRRPTFANTIVALDFTGALLEKVSLVFSNLNSAETNDELQQIARDISPMLSEHRDNIFMNDDLFRRIERLYNRRARLRLTGEQNRLLENYYRDFVRRGAALNDDDKERMREINTELGMLVLAFQQNVLAETNSFQRFVTNRAELAGLTPGIIQSAAEAAAAAGRPGTWLFTIHKPSFIPVLQYGENRELRRELFTAFINQGNNDNEHDNKDIVNQIVRLRIERARLLGFETHADYILVETMAKTPERVLSFLEEVWRPAVAKAAREAEELQALMHRDLPGEALQPWDWWFYTERLRLERYNLDEGALRPYFKADNVLQGAFDVSTALFGITFERLEGMPIYHPDVEVFRVNDYDGSLLGILYIDHFPRAGKRHGAWMSSYRRQSVTSDGKRIFPIVTNVGNYSPPVGDKPALLSMSDVKTLFHELGHGLHGLLSNVNYPSLAGTSVPRDFVELPSQVMEHWAFQPEVLRMYAFHYETGEVIPDELIEKIQKTRTFNQGFGRTEVLASAWLDMDIHMRNTTDEFDVNEFEKASMERAGLIPEIVPRWRTTKFMHIFPLMYSAGYYSYTWSAVLDADAFQAFVETGDILDREIGMRFRREILERGGSEDAMQMWLNFRGAEPNPIYFMRNVGLVK